MTVNSQPFEEEKAAFKSTIDDLYHDRPALLQFITDPPQDPDTERLLDGISHLYSQIAQHRQQQTPELARGMVDLLWPNRMRPMPSMTVLQFQGDGQSLPVSLNRGLEVASQPVPISDTTTEPGDRLPCTFRTCRDLKLSPLSMRDVTALHGTLNLHFATDSPQALDSLGLEHLNLYLGHHTHTGAQLLLWLCHYLEDATLHLEDRVIPLPDVRFRVQGMAAEDDALLPYPRNVFSGDRLLQEYFCFPPAFLFVQASGFPTLPADLAGQRMTLRLYFSRPLPTGLVLTAQSAQLHCTPAVNLFSHSAEAILLQGNAPELPLQASYRRRAGYDIFSVDHVEGQVAERPDLPVRTYSAFEHFHHQSPTATPHYYRLHTRLAQARDQTRCGFEHALSFIRPDETDVYRHQEVVSVQLTCTNRDLPARLNIGDLCHSTQLPLGIGVRNLTRPSLPLYPAADDRQSASLLSGMTLNSGSVLSADALRQLLRLHDLPACYNANTARAAEYRLAAIASLTSHHTERYVQQLLVEGIESVLCLRQKGAFDSEGELYLFGTLLSRLLAHYASINTFHLLRVCNLDNKETYAWPHPTLS